MLIIDESGIEGLQGVVTSHAEALIISCKNSKNSENGNSQAPPRFSGAERDAQRIGLEVAIETVGDINANGCV